MTSNTGAARPTVADLLADGPQPGKRFEARAVESRPPDTVDVAADDGDLRSTSVEEWIESGPSADYTFLFTA